MISKLAGEVIPSDLDETLRAGFYKVLRKEHETEAALHQPSGRLSAGQLSKPLLEQILKIVGVPPKPVDDYTLGQFARGDAVEEWVIHCLEPEKTQVEVKYRNAVGFIDAIKNDDVFEVKSIKNSAVRYIDPENTKRTRRDGELVPEYSGPKYKDALQGGFYAAAKKRPYFWIIYVATDDLRTYPHKIETDLIKPEIDRIISEVARQLKTGTLPRWQEREEWQRKYPKYNNYPEWVELEPDLATEKLKRQYPEAYKKLIAFGKGVKNASKNTGTKTKRGPVPKRPSRAGHKPKKTPGGRSENGHGSIPTKTTK